MLQNRFMTRVASVLAILAMSAGLVPRAMGAASSGSSALIDGRVGGQLACQAWVVDVPAGAFNGVATVSLSVVNGANPTIDISISNPQLNKFQLPVSLRFRAVSAKGKSIFLWDPATQSWARVPLQITNYNTNVLTAFLLHFSTYSVQPTGGKAGW
jgi:hypothetical protein